MVRLSILLIAALTLICGPAHADTERRVALIIGNDSYKSLKRLENGANDARAMERELKAIGFETILKVNAGRKEMYAAINDFGGKLASGSVGLFYFAGHGIQSGEKNFLVPVDADLQSEDDLISDAIDAGRVTQAMEVAKNRLNIVVLDACRDNPLPKGGRSGVRGLAVMQAPTGALVAYATGPGKSAQDGDKGGNGVYTGELIKALREPGLTIEQVFKKAAAGVIEKTGGKQVPWMQASLTGDFYLRPGTSSRQAAVSAGGPDKELLFWQSIKDSHDPSEFEAYLDQFPNGTFGGLARGKIDALKGAAAMPARSEPTLEALDREMVAVRKASLREAPHPKAKVLATLKEGDVVQVMGKVKGENWYLVSRKGYPTAYLVTETLEEASIYRERVVKAEAARIRDEQDRTRAEAEQARAEQTRVLAEQERERERARIEAQAAAGRKVVVNPRQAGGGNGGVGILFQGLTASPEIKAAPRESVQFNSGLSLLELGGAAPTARVEQPPEDGDPSVQIQQILEKILPGITR